jgi:hypothetical protein
MKESLARWFAYKLPRRVVYWAAIRLMAHGTVGEYRYQVVPDLYAMDALQRWERP